MAVRYLVSGPGGKHLPVSKDDGAPDHRLMGAAWAALHEGFEGHAYAGADKDEAISTLRSLYEAESMTPPGDAAKAGGERQPNPEDDEHDADDEEEGGDAGDEAEDDDEDDPEEHLTADKRRQADDPGVSDVHVNTPLGTDAPKKRNKLTHYARHFMSGLRASFGDKTALSPDDVATAMAAAHAHATRKGIKAARSAAEMSSWHAAASTPIADIRKAQRELAQFADDNINGDDAASGPGVCPACGDYRFSDCTCDSCKEGNPGACNCLPPQVWNTAGVSGIARQAADPLVSDTGERFKVWLPRAFGEHAWEPCLPKPGTFTHPKYGKLSITREHNEAIVRNVNDRVRGQDIPVDAEHDIKASGALGHIKQLRLNADGSADAHVDWNPRGQIMLSEDRFRYVSPEWFDTWKDPVTLKTHKNVLIGLAITTNPFFKEGHLRPLVASESGFSTPDQDEIPPHAGEEPDMPNEGTRTYAEAEVKAFQEEARQAREEANQAREEAKQARERIEVVEKREQRKQFTDEALERHVPADGYVALMESLPQEQRDAVKAFMDPIIKQRNEGGLFESYGQRGRGASSAEGQIEALTAEKQQRNPKLTKEQAYSEVLTDHPDLYAQQIAESES
ncbi:MAG: hypothetical protein JWO59_726 [Chloroflexi bacterium]|nr:hypothetical protein [Chloroflexota bacterium]